ncbi:MAG: hypothetical protein O3B22_05190 [Proteobacteria bacterium]|nr:hypothetical protein [Pseudomonadota bacterium]
MSAPATPGGAALRDHFMGWQCRIRQHAVRTGKGRPTEGMTPAVTAADGEELGAVVVLIIERDPDMTTAQFRHTVQRTMDPAERFEKAVDFLSSAYFQKARAFEPRLFALFGPASPGAARLAGDGRCVLSFSQFSQSYRLPARVEALDEDDPFAQGLIWHNACFNPAQPPGCIPLAFDLVWDEGTAFPPVG